MSIEIEELDQMQQEYKVAVDQWVDSIRSEEALASGDHSLTEIDRWEIAGLAEEALRSKVKAAKKKYEAALRLKFFHFS